MYSDPPDLYLDRKTRLPTALQCIPTRLRYATSGKPHDFVFGHQDLPFDRKTCIRQHDLPFDRKTCIRQHDLPFDRKTMYSRILRLFLNRSDPNY